MPIWAAVLNRAARGAQLRSGSADSRSECNDTVPDAQTETASEQSTYARLPGPCLELPAVADTSFSAAEQQSVDAGCSTAESPSDIDCKTLEEWESVYFPLWITQTERALVAPLLSSWTEQFVSTCRGAVPQYLADLSKPLRPLWISQSSLIWTNQIARPESHSFTPIYLVSASLPLLYHRRVTSIPRGVSQQHEEDAIEDAAPETISYVYVHSFSLTTETCL